jgi:hypothetical protein
MAIKTGAAALTSKFVVTAIIGIPITTGYLDTTTNEIVPIDTGTWFDISGLTWEDFTSWNNNPGDVMWWVSNPIQFNVVQDFNLKILIEANGIVDYYVYTSTTGAFNGEEVQTVVLNGDQNVSGFNGKVVIVAVKVTKTTGINKISGITITASNKPISEVQSNVSTSTLAGSITARQLTTARSYSIISDIDVAVQETTAYALDLYVSNYATSKTLIPRVVSKSRTAPTIALMGIDGSNKDGIVDITISGLPEQYMSGNNLFVR